MRLHSESKLISKLRDRDFRSAFVSSRINNFLAFQIRALRQKKKWSQVELAKRLKTSQNAVSRMENPSYGKHSITTLKRLGEIFDVGVVVWFVPFSELIKRAANLSTENVIVPSFEEEFGTTDHDDVESEREEKEQSAIKALLENLPSAPAIPFSELDAYIRNRGVKPGRFFEDKPELFQGGPLGEEPAESKVLRRLKHPPPIDDVKLRSIPSPQGS